MIRLVLVSEAGQPLMLKPESMEGRMDKPVYKEAKFDSDEVGGLFNWGFGVEMKLASGRGLVNTKSGHILCGIITGPSPVSHTCTSFLSLPCPA